MFPSENIHQKITNWNSVTIKQSLPMHSSPLYCYFPTSIFPLNKQPQASLHDNLWCLWQYILYYNLYTSWWAIHPELPSIRALKQCFIKPYVHFSVILENFWTSQIYRVQVLIKCLSLAKCSAWFGVKDQLVCVEWINQWIKEEYPWPEEQKVLSYRFRAIISEKKNYTNTF